MYSNFKQKLDTNLNQVSTSIRQREQAYTSLIKKVLKPFSRAFSLNNTVVNLIFIAQNKIIL